MKELIDFDSQFNEYMDSWADELLKQGKKPEEIEALIPEAYEKWASDAKKYFENVDSAELVKMLGAYLDEEITPPDILIEEIVGNQACEQGVFELFMQERPNQDKTLLMNVLSDMQSSLPVQEYISILCSVENEELADAAAEALKYAGKDAIGQVLSIYDEEKDITVKEKLMYVLVYSEPKTENLASRLIELMKQSGNRAFIAGMMGFYGDESCIDVLKLAEEAKDISYIDYVEICDAIESLGGETKRDREFDGDDYYEMMHSGGFDQ